MPHKSTTEEYRVLDHSNLKYLQKVETSLVEDGQFEYFGQPLKNASRIVKMLERLAWKDREVGIVLFLDRNDNPIGYDYWTGGLDFVAIDPRQIVKLMCMLNAIKVVFAHNHPEGDPRPSRGDEAFCLQFCQLSLLMGWEVSDFIIIGRPEYYSFREKNNPSLLTFSRNNFIIDEGVKP
jgi:DNA repair protein RadC